ncbi:MAG: BlaI/MecI/CopY family transcriptional regulator [Acidobacteria bacterium]|nr:BlaI/MecI/CopY family transcriptional regulator [Acidobacteriota bacterium]MBU4494313.1 BlaI/MecI/CopY family transcriptional regulator [Acidobacteriota bacterium]
MKKELPRIADSEWRVMQVLWEHGPQTANDVVKALSDKVKWRPRTIKTLISRLVQKGAVKVTEKGYRYQYSSAVDESACIQSETKSFVRRVYQETMTPALAAFLEDADLSAQEIDELQEILDKKKGG